MNFIKVLLILIVSQAMASETSEVKEPPPKEGLVKSRDKRFVWFPYNSCFAVIICHIL